jgi:hypothetical protein
MECVAFFGKARCLPPAFRWAKLRRQASAFLAINCRKLRVAMPMKLP